MSNRERIWRWLKRHGPVERRDIIKALKLSPNIVNCSLDRMRINGHVGRTINERRVASWYTLGDCPPVSMLGTHPNTLRNLNQRRDVAMQRLRKAFIARGFDPSALDAKPPAPVSDGCLLAQCWGNSKSCRQEEENALCS